MNSQDFERKMRSFEYFHSLRLLPATWTVIRVDGRSFSRFTESRFEKPFDLRFHDWMVSAATALLEELTGLYAYTESDEISLLLDPSWELFDRELEKTVSISASIAAAAFTHACGEPVHFDSRVWVGVDTELVVDYFRWRMADAARCALNGWCYWTLRQAGRSVAEATHALEKQSTAFKNELLFQHGINFNNLPLWQRRGTGLYWETYSVIGYNPQSQAPVPTVRRRIKVDEDLPLGDDYNGLLQTILRSKTAAKEEVV